VQKVGKSRLWLRVVGVAENCCGNVVSAEAGGCWEVEWYSIWSVVCCFCFMRPTCRHIHELSLGI